MDTLDLPTIDPDLIDSAKPEVAAEVVDMAAINDGKPLVKYSATEAGLAALRKELTGKTYDLKTTKGDQEARADRLRCVTLRTTLEKRRKAFKEPALEYGKLIDAEAKRITAEIEKLEKPIDDAIKADEARRAAEKAERERIEAERVAKHRAKIATIRGYVDLARGKNIERIASGIRYVQGMVIGDDYEEFAEAAEQARTEVLAALTEMHAAAVKAVEEEEERERQRAENARVAAELAEQRRALEAEAARVRAEAEALARQKAEAEAAAAAAKAKEDEGAKALLDAMTMATQAAEAGALGEPSAPQADLIERARGIVDDIIAAETLSDAIKAAPGPLLALGKINDRLGFTLTREFIADRLGIAHHGTDKRAFLYTEAQYAAIVAALIEHLRAKVKA